MKNRSIRDLKNFRKGIVLTMALCLSLLVSKEAEAAEYGEQIFTTTCDGGATITLYDSDGNQSADTLVVSGSGATDNYSGKKEGQDRYAETPYMEYASEITQAVIMKEVTGIGDRTFYYMKNLEQVSFEEGSHLATIGQSAFAGCEKIGTFEIPKSVVTLKDEVFSSCAGLTEVSFLSDETLASIGGYCFSNCTSLTEMVLPDSITTIGSNAFQKCVNLESIKLPVNLTGGLNATFLDCVKLEKIEIPDGVTQLGNNAFSGCTALTDVIFSENTQLTTLGDNVFYDCDALTTLTIPKTVHTITKRPIVNCDSLNMLIIETALLTSSNIGGALVAASNVNTVIYPEIYRDNDCEIYNMLCPSTIYTQLATTEENDGTISVKVIRVPDGATKIECPGVIAGKKVGKITYAEGIDASGIITVGCHVGNMQMDASGHWQEEIVCSLCGQTVEKIEKTPHQYLDDGITCSCGYVKPVVITESPDSLNLVYGYSRYKTLSASYEKKVDATISCYWTENGEVVKKSINEYNFATGKDAGEYTIIFQVQTQKYEINGESVEGEAYKFIAQSEPAVVTVKKRPITVQICSVSRYAGDENPQFSVEVVSGSLAYDDTTNDLAMNFFTKAAQTSACGAYEITGMSENGNYEVTVLPGTLTVTKKPADSTGNGGTSKDANDTQIAVPKAGEKLSTSSALYRVITPGDSNGKIGTVTYVRPNKITVKTVSVPATVTIGGIKYQVTAIGANAFKNCNKLKKVTIGKYVSKIGKKAFYKCKKLKTIIIKSKKLSAKKVGSKAFKGINSKATIKIPKSKYKSYKKWLKKKGVGSKVKIKKM